MKYLSLICMTFVMFFSIESYSQTAEEIEQMKAEKAEKEARAAELKSELDALTGEIKSIQSTLDGFVKWRFGSGGLLGADFNRFNNWAPKAELNSSASTITFGYSGFANYIDEKYFWRNTGNINLGWLRFDNDTQVDELGETNDFNEVSDIINAQSLFGYNLSPKLAASAAAEFRSSILSNFNNPGYLDLGAGITYTPLPNLVIIV